VLEHPEQLTSFGTAAFKGSVGHMRVGSHLKEYGALGKSLLCSASILVNVPFVFGVVCDPGPILFGVKGDPCLLLLDLDFALRLPTKHHSQ